MPMKRSSVGSVYNGRLLPSRRELLLSILSSRVDREGLKYLILKTMPISVMRLCLPKGLARVVAAPRNHGCRGALRWTAA